MSVYPSAILTKPVPALARHLFFILAKPEALPEALAQLQQLDCSKAVVGVGLSLVKALNKNVPALRSFPAMTGPGVDVPSTQHALWVWLYGEDRGDVLQRTHRLEQALAPALMLVECTEAFRYQAGHDLTGYEDGTENPLGDDAIAAAFATDALGGSYAAIQKWTHDLQCFAGYCQTDQDHMIGRRISDNQEIEDAPEYAHVKRTAQESFEPEAFIVRRSMPWIEGQTQGLMFLAFGHSLDAFEVQMRRMAGLDDGIVDGLFKFSRPVTGGYYWCPPLNNQHLNLTHLL